MAERVSAAAAVDAGSVGIDAQAALAALKTSAERAFGAGTRRAECVAMLALHADRRGVAQLEYLVVLTMICIPLFFALVPLAIKILRSYVDMREVMLYGIP
ncbi:MAG: hypothetical protein QM756_15895 [Polyangiaceae bacterium]